MFLKQDSANEKPPVTTVFVGNISDRAPDSMIKQMLQVSLHMLHCHSRFCILFFPKNICLTRLILGHGKDLNFDTRHLLKIEVHKHVLEST